MYPPKMFTALCIATFSMFASVAAVSYMYLFVPRPKQAGSNTETRSAKEVCKLMDKANSLRERKDFCKAIALFTEAGVSDAISQQTRAEAISQLIDCWENTVRLNPQSQNHTGLAHALIWGERFDEAEIELKEALRLDANNKPAKTLMAYIPTARKDSKPRLLVNEGVDLQLAHQNSRAIEKYKEALSTNPAQVTRVYALLNLGTAYHSKGDHLGAARYYTETLLTQPGEPTAIKGIQTLVTTKLNEVRRSIPAR